MAQAETSTDTTACPTCPTGRLEEGTTALTFPETIPEEKAPSKSRSPIIVVTGVPAEVCDTCGESIVDSDTAKHVRALVKDVGFWWGRDPAKLDVEGIVVGGEPGEEGGIVRVDFEITELPHERVSVREK
jgi:hypothetical protein